VGHHGSVNAVAVARIHARDVVVSGGDDQTVRLWDVATRVELAVLDLLAPVSSLVIDETGQRLYIATGRAVATIDLTRIRW
jgi:WD40 repeat protein